VRRVLIVVLTLGFLLCVWRFKTDALLLLALFLLPFAALLPGTVRSRVRYDASIDSLSVSSANGETVHKSIWEIEDVRVIGAPPEDEQYAWYVIVEDTAGATSIVGRALVLDAAVADARRIRDLVSESQRIMRTRAYR
jgi:hypothetical protein